MSDEQKRRMFRCSPVEGERMRGCNWLYVFALTSAFFLAGCATRHLKSEFEIHPLRRYIERLPRGIPSEPLKRPMPGLWQSERFIFAKMTIPYGTTNAYICDGDSIIIVQPNGKTDRLNRDVHRWERFWVPELARATRKRLVAIVARRAKYKEWHSEEDARVTIDISFGTRTKMTCLSCSNAKGNVAPMIAEEWERAVAQLKGAPVQKIITGSEETVKRMCLWISGE